MSNNFLIAHTKSATLLTVSALAFGLLGCDPNTAGVVTETESGTIAYNSCSNDVPGNYLKKSGTDCIEYYHEARFGRLSGKVIDEQGNPVKNAEVILAKASEYYISENTVKSTTTDENGDYVFRKVVYSIKTFDYPTYDRDADSTIIQDVIEYPEYRIFVEKGSELGAILSTSAEEFGVYETGDTLNFSVDDIPLEKTNAITIPFDELNRKFSNNLQAGDKICIGKSASCITLTKADLSKENIVIEGVPNGSFEGVCRIQKGLDFPECFNTSDPKWNWLFQDNQQITQYSLILPEGVADSIKKLKGNSHLDSLIVFESDSAATPLTLSKAYAGGSMGVGTSLSPAAQGNDRIREYMQSNRELRTIEGPVFVDSSVAVSFDFAFDMTLVNTHEMVLVDATFEGEDSSKVGFEIRSCKEDVQKLCVKIYNGLDSASSDSVEYLGEKLLDGTSHKFAMAIHKKHLNITIDGKTVRDTDLKLDENFYKPEDLKLGAAPITHFVYFSFGDYIRQKQDEGWSRLKAWMIAHQTATVFGG